MPDKPENRQLAGLASMALAAFFFSLMSLQVKLVGTRLPNQEIVLVRSLLTLVLTLAALWRAGVSPWGRARGLLILRGLTGFGALSCFFYSVTHLPLAEATVIQFTNPVLTALLASLFLRELLDRTVLLGTITSLTGVLLIARPAIAFGAWSSEVDTGTAVIALCGALLTAAAYVCVRGLARTDHPLVVILYFPLVSVPAAAVWGVPGWVWPTPWEWVLLAGMGIATQLGQIFLTRGLYRESAGRATSISYLQLVFATLWGLFFFAEVPAPATWLGAALIVGGSLLAARYPSRQPGAPMATGRAAPPGAR